MTWPLKGKNVLITGGSAGLGAVVSQTFARQGCNVAINYAHRKEKAESLAQKISETWGVRAVTIQGTIGDSDQVCKSVIASTVDQLGSIDVVISNAGWTKIVPFKNIDEIDDDLWDGCMNVNVKSHFYLFREAQKHFENNEDGGHFLITGSVGGLRPSGSSIPYVTSKAALNHLVKCLARTFGPKSRVNVICPGLLLTEWGDRFGEEMIEAVKQCAPLKQETVLEDVANMFVSMAQNTSMTGAVVSVDSGLGLEP